MRPSARSWVKMLRAAGALAVVSLATSAMMGVAGAWVVTSAPPLQPPDDVADDEAPSPAPPPPQTTGKRRVADRVTAYNVFCPTCGPAPTKEFDDTSGGAPLAGAPRSALPIVLAATMEATTAAGSLATIVDARAGGGGLYTVGDSPLPGVEIVSIAAGVVHVRNAGSGGRLEYIPIDAPPPARSTSQPKSKPKPKPKPRANSIPGAAEAIACDDGSGTCRVERQFVESLIKDPSVIRGQGVFRPSSTKDGRNGFRLSGVRRGTLPHMLGLRSGDIITEVGGMPATIDNMATLYTKLRRATNVEFTVDRKGKPVTRRLEIE